MPFPESHRVRFKKNPLRQVICQLRFPPILKIDTGIPADFQDRIRNSFPNFSEISEWKIEFPKVIGGALPPEIADQVSQSAGNKNYSFLTEDEKNKINLTRTFIALSTINYHVWEEFRSMLENILKIFVDIYNPSYYSRIGLRYIDIITRSELGLKDVDWNSLLKPHVLGIISDPYVGKNVEDYESKYLIGLEDGESIVRIISKLINNEPTNEDLFVIDSDFFGTQKIAPNNVMELLNFYNTRASRLINWAILPRLFDAMEPEDI